MSRDKLVERFSLDRVSASPATFDYQKLDWMNGVYAAPSRRTSSPNGWSPTCASARSTGTPTSSVVQPRWCRRRSKRSGAFPSSHASGGAGGRGGRLRRRRDADARTVGAALADVEPFEAEPIEHALRAAWPWRGSSPGKLSGRSGVAVTGSTVSPGLFESLELLGRDESLERLKRRGRREA